MQTNKHFFFKREGAIKQLDWIQILHADKNNMCTKFLTSFYI